MNPEDAEAQLATALNQKSSGRVLLPGVVWK